jgi:hypothetical protein
MCTPDDDYTRTRNGRIHVYIASKPRAVFYLLSAERRKDPKKIHTENYILLSIQVSTSGFQPIRNQTLVLHFVCIFFVIVLCYFSPRGEVVTSFSV